MSHLSHHSGDPAGRTVLTFGEPKHQPFLDPSYVLRALHVIPRFSSGKLNTLTPPSDLVNKNQLWHEYYINRFADRDLFMRYQYGMSIGHRHYMNDPDFPPWVTIPMVPTDFDYGLREVHQPHTETTMAMKTDPPSEEPHGAESIASSEGGPSRAGGVSTQAFTEEERRMEEYRRPGQMGGVEREPRESRDDRTEDEGRNDDEPREDNDYDDGSDDDGEGDGGDDLLDYEEDRTEEETEGEEEDCNEVDSDDGYSEHIDE